MPDRFSDADLVAFLDERLDESRREAITLALRTDVELRERLDSFDVAGGVDEIAAAFAALLNQAPEYQSADEAAKDVQGRDTSNIVDISRSKNTSVRTPINPWWAAGIGAIAASLLLGLVVTTILPRGFGSWQNYAASYHLLYITETLEEAVADTARSTELANRLGFDLSRVTDVGDEFTFKRAQILGFEGGKILQLAYLADDGQPMAFCLMQSNSSDQSNVVKTMHQIATTAWSEGPFEYVTLGGGNQPQLARFTQEIQARL